MRIVSYSHPDLTTQARTTFGVVAPYDAGIIDVGARIGDGDRVFEMGGKLTITSHHHPSIFRSVVDQM